MGYWSINPMFTQQNIRTDTRNNLIVGLIIDAEAS